ncbi:MAG TPA: tRNA dihydrouridine synthase DusB [Acidobacteriota bacterium]|nr:tRNA dihydrouridine synthase DusB [Acidobacteriota bacterium]HND20289.1 tRNA dihydrouridine synthase DusB [Acidobacteriota bacterium]HNG91787.1 tRNA dihydrouridine synthase DusB [Acidobacteriota bacterium]
MDRQEFFIRDIPIRPRLALAPMAGVTDSAFRGLIKSLGGVGLIVTEFISVEGLTRGNLKTHRMMHFEEFERPISIQFFGYDPERMAVAAEVGEAAGADIVDVNCGCPARKVVHRGAGSSLLKDLPHLEKILKGMRKAIKIPLTLKMRIGWDDSSIVAVEVGKLAQDCGVEALAIHGRTRVQGYSGQADWNVIAQVKEAVSIPVMGSGDVTTIDQALTRFRETGVDGVMIGRGAMANPWIFRQIDDVMQGRSPFQPTLIDKRNLLFGYFDVMLKELPSELAAMGKVKQLCGQFTKGLPGGAAFRQQVFHSQSRQELTDKIDFYFTLMAEREAAGNLVPAPEDAADDTDSPTTEEYACQA